MSKKIKDPSKGGRPTKYKPEYCKKLVEYFDQPLYVYVEVEKMSASGAVKVVKEREANDLPTFEGFAQSIGVSHEVLIDWCKVHDEFLQAYSEAKGFQKKFIFNHGVKGNYNANFTKFFAVNCLGMRETTHVETVNEHKVEGYGLAFDLSKDPEDL